MSYEIDPTNIPKRMTREQLEYWILFGICVANKPAKVTQKKVTGFLEGLPGETPFKKVHQLMCDSDGVKAIHRRLREFRMGQYMRITVAFAYVSTRLDLDKLSVAELEKVPGIGPKTARMIMLYYDPTCEAVPLDTHVLKYLRKKRVKDVPKSTPPAGRTYNRLEAAFQVIAKQLNRTVRQLDTEVWGAYANT